MLRIEEVPAPFLRDELHAGLLEFEAAVRMIPGMVCTNG